MITRKGHTSFLDKIRIQLLYFLRKKHLPNKVGLLPPFIILQAYLLFPFLKQGSPWRRLNHLMTLSRCVWASDYSYSLKSPIDI